MKKLITIFLIFALFLAGCARGPVATAAVQVTEQIFTTQPPALDSPASPTTAPTQTSEPSVTEVVTTQPTTAETAPVTPNVAVPDTGDGALVYAIDPAQSTVTYEVGETFLNQNNRFNTAVGVTQGISGEVTIDRTTPQNSSLGPVTVDIRQLTSDQPRRDNAIRDRFLESARFPQAVFTPNSIEGLPATIQEGVDIPLKISGDLKIREVTRPVTFDTIVQLQGDILTGLATTQILMSDFGFGPISIAGIVNTEDQVKVTFDFVAMPKN